MASSRRTAHNRPTESKKVLCDYCTEEKLEALKSCLDCGVSFCLTHLMPHKTVAKFKTHKLIHPAETLENYFCKKRERPLELLCRDDQTCVCQFCMNGDHKTHTTVPIGEEFRSQLGLIQADVPKMIQNQLKKIQELKSSVELSKNTSEKEKADVEEIFSALMRCVERSQAELLKVMEEKQKAAERQAEEFIKEVEQEITELKRRNSDLEQLSHTEDHLHLLQIYPSLCRPPHTSDWADVRIDSHLNVETLRIVLSQLQKSLNEEMEKVPGIKLKRIWQYAVDVTLDGDTGNPALILSDDGKQVRHGDLRQILPDNVKRFDHFPCIL